MKPAKELRKIDPENPAPYNLEWLIAESARVSRALRMDGRDWGEDWESRLLNENCQAVLCAEADVAQAEHYLQMIKRLVDGQSDPVERVRLFGEKLDIYEMAQRAVDRAINAALRVAAIRALQGRQQSSESALLGEIVREVHAKTPKMKRSSIASEAREIYKARTGVDATISSDSLTKNIPRILRQPPQ